MARVCDICNKTAIMGIKYSHSHKRTNRRWEANIKKIRVIVNGTPKRLNVCTSCIRSGKVQRAI
ncbi:50S ribosomal protein L28 [Caldanaerobius polysaccharolyticus]|uniref:50S ribosomal protein L28 n=1 Tax=Caldanaerobius polysaccharolyticus TaxID=44256 RepID=UPI00047C4BFC|nr:50S ribosomal protein L28 [Caldanaerobius polysaccharolyticus]